MGCALTLNIGEGVPPTHFKRVKMCVILNTKRQWILYKYNLVCIFCFY